MSSGIQRVWPDPAGELYTFCKRCFQPMGIHRRMVKKIFACPKCKKSMYVIAMDEEENGEQVSSK